MRQLWRALGDLPLLLSMPRARIDLMYRDTAGNDPFFARITREHYETTQRRHPKLWFVRQQSLGVSVCVLPATFEEYFATIEASARRNYKKAVRHGYVCERIDFNGRRDEIREIRQSTDVRQGRLPDELLHGSIDPCSDPPSRTALHDYSWFGILKDGKLVAYAGCLVAGQLCTIEHILGHAAHQANGVVPMLIIEIAAAVYRAHPQVRFFAYGTFFGASESLRRFKKKMAFVPHRVDWHLGDASAARGASGVMSDQPPVEIVLGIPGNLVFQTVYRQRRDAPLPITPAPGARYHYVATPFDLWRIRAAARAHLGRLGFLKTALKVATPRRVYYGVVVDERIVSDGWVTFGFCRYYRVEREDAVIGPVWTNPDCRGRGLATFGLARAINSLYQRGYRVTYIDTYKDHRVMQAVISRCGYGLPVALYLRGYQPAE